MIQERKPWVIERLSGEKLTESMVTELKDYYWATLNYSTQHLIRDVYAAGLAEGRKLNAAASQPHVAEVAPGSRKPVIVAADPEHDDQRREFLVMYSEGDVVHFFDAKNPVFNGTIGEIESYVTGLLDAGVTALRLEDLYVYELHECAVEVDEAGNVSLEAT